MGFEGGDHRSRRGCRSSVGRERRRSSASSIVGRRETIVGRLSSDRGWRGFGPRSSLTCRFPSLSPLSLSGTAALDQVRRSWLVVVTFGCFVVVFYLGVLLWCFVVVFFLFFCLVFLVLWCFGVLVFWCFGVVFCCGVLCLGVLFRFGVLVFWCFGVLCFGVLFCFVLCFCVLVFGVLVFCCGVLLWCFVVASCCGFLLWRFWYLGIWVFGCLGVWVFGCLVFGCFVLFWCFGVWCFGVLVFCCGVLVFCCGGDAFWGAWHAGRRPFCSHPWWPSCPATTD